MNWHILLECHLLAAYLCRIISNHPFTVHTEGTDNSTLHIYSTPQNTHTYARELVIVAEVYSLRKKAMVNCEISHINGIKDGPMFEMVY
jgi:hypothetical protein